MRQIIDFFVRNKNFILFVFLFSVSLTLLFTSSNFHKSYFLNSTNLISGNIYEFNKSIKDYFNLGKINEDLSLENQSLRERLYNLNLKNQQYNVFNARVIKNSYSLTNNYITINEKKLLFINIQGTNLKRSSELQDANIKTLSKFIYKVFNQIKIRPNVI